MKLLSTEIHDWLKNMVSLSKYEFTLLSSTLDRINLNIVDKMYVSLTSIDSLAISENSHN